MHQKVKVTVTDVDVNRKRIALSMKETEKREPSATARPRDNKPAQKTFVQKQPARKPATEPEMDMLSKLAALKNKFK